MGWKDAVVGKISLENINNSEADLIKCHYQRAFPIPYIWVVSDPQSVVVCSGIPGKVFQISDRKYIQKSSPRYCSTRHRNKYPITSPIQLLGTIQAPSHVPVASSTTAQIGNPILYNLSWPSPDHRKRHTKESNGLPTV